MIVLGTKIYFYWYLFSMYHYLPLAINVAIVFSSSISCATGLRQVYADSMSIAFCLRQNAYKWLLKLHFQVGIRRPSSGDSTPFKWGACRPINPCLVYVTMTSISVAFLLGAGAIKTQVFKIGQILYYCFSVIFWSDRGYKNPSCRR